MLDLSTSCFYKLKINANHVDFVDFFRPSQYNGFQGKIPRFMKKDVRHTLVIDLTQTEDEIMQGMKSNTRNEVRRAIRENFFFEPVTNHDEFVEFYNEFAMEKNIETINKGHLHKYGENLLLFKSGVNGITMTMHASFIDNDLKQVALLYSASVRFGEGIDKKNVGFSNRFLHYMEFLKFKELGYKTYDFEGVCTDPEDKERYPIGQFKSGFGGEDKNVVQLFSYPFVLAMWLKNIIQK